MTETIEREGRGKMGDATTKTQGRQAGVQPSHRSIIEAAQSALRDLYGLIPQADRKYADDNLRTLEHALNGYSNALDCMRQLEAVLHHGNQYQKHKLAEIEEIG